MVDGVVDGEVGPDGVGGLEADDVAHVVFRDTGDHASAFQEIYHFAFEFKGVGLLLAGAEEERDEEEQEVFLHDGWMLVIKRLPQSRAGRC